MSKAIKVFRYIEELDAFLPTEDFSFIVKELDLVEWNDVVFVGRFLTLDNDYGEHMFDLWDEREERAEKAKEMGIDESSLLIVDPKRFVNGYDGPCHSDELRKLFWTDVFKSLSLSLEFLFEEARQNNLKIQNSPLFDNPPNIEEKIEIIKQKFAPLV